MNCTNFDELNLNELFCRMQRSSPYAKKCANWCFTNHLLEDKIDSSAGGRIVYVVWQLEVCPTSGKVHQQGYLELKTATSLGSVKTLLPGAHWTPARGSGQQNTDYCTKMESRAKEGYDTFTFGVMKGQGKRTDLKELAEEIKEAPVQGLTFASVCLSRPDQYIKYNKGMEKLDFMVRQSIKVRAAPKILWLRGESGSGKTHAVREALLSSDAPYYRKPAGNKWWDGYNGERIVWLDDFDRESVAWRLLLNVLDRDVIKVEIKGGFVNLFATTFIFTSNEEPKVIYYDVLDMLPLLRRIEEGGHYISAFHRPDKCYDYDCIECEQVTKFLLLK